MKNRLYIFLGTLIFFYLLYIRIIKERLPGSIENSRNIFYYLFFISFCTAFILSLFQYFRIDLNKNNKSLLSKIMGHEWFPTNIWNTSLKALDAQIKNSMPVFNTHMTWAQYIIDLISKFFAKYVKYSLIIVIILRILVQILICICFLYDVFITFHFVYFYKGLPLLIIPLSISYIMYSIKTQAETDLMELDKVLSLKIIHKNDCDEFKDVSQILANAIEISIEQWQKFYWGDTNSEFICLATIKDSSMSTNSDNVLNFCLAGMNHCFIYINYTEDYNLYIQRIELPFNLFRYSLYASGWFYIILQTTIT